MALLLHILTEANDTLAAKIIAQQKLDSENKVEVVDLILPGADYKELLEKIFEADSVQVW
jgi:hypothetical protein